MSLWPISVESMIEDGFLDVMQWLVPDEVSIAPNRTTACRACGRQVLWCVVVSGGRRPFDQDGTSHYRTCQKGDVTAI